jgi:hypothetical protein
MTVGQPLNNLVAGIGEVGLQLAIVWDQPEPAPVSEDRAWQVAGQEECVALIAIKRGAADPAIAKFPVSLGGPAKRFLGGTAFRLDPFPERSLSLIEQGLLRGRLDGD